MGATRALGAEPYAADQVASEHVRPLTQPDGTHRHLVLHDVSIPPPTVAALFVETGGVYFDLPGVDPWDEARDARLYDGPHPVVAHPPCSRWCRLAGLVEARWGHKRGDDGGCFEAALNAVRTWGGVLEHPAYSDAWDAYGLPVPNRRGGWHSTLWDDGWSCHVEQGRYGHPAKKATWLYAVGCELPDLRWGSVPDGSSQALVSWCGNHTSRFENRPRVGKAAAARTPQDFQDVLLSIARSLSLASCQRVMGFVHGCPGSAVKGRTVS